MLHYAIVFLIVALIAAFLGFGLAGTAALIEGLFRAFPDLRNCLVPQKRLAAALRYQETGRG
jgi:hypothetical protein